MKTAHTRLSQGLRKLEGKGHETADENWSMKIASGQGKLSNENGIRLWTAPWNGQEAAWKRLCQSRNGQEPPRNWQTCYETPITCGSLKSQRTYYRMRLHEKPIRSQYRMRAPENAKAPWKCRANAMQKPMQKSIRSE